MTTTDANSIDPDSDEARLARMRDDCRTVHPAISKARQAALDAGWTPPGGITWDNSGRAYRSGECDRAACEINPCNGSCKTRAPEVDKMTGDQGSAPQVAQPTNSRAAGFLTVGVSKSVGMKISVAPIWKPTERLCVGPDGLILQAWIEMVSGRVELRRLPTTDELMQAIPGLAGQEGGAA